jgi:two-component system, NarL family, sensor histidine kinase DesK
MLTKYRSILKSTGISPYIWTVLSILPFYFISQAPSKVEIVIGVTLTILFFIFYRLAFVSKGWLIYLWTCIVIGISIATTSLYGYVYFAFFLAYLIGNIRDRVPFLILYFIHLVATSIAINYKIVLHEEMFLKQLPFVLIILVSVILLPFSIRFRKERGQLEEKLDDANKRIAELVKQEERQRIARDLHDTLGQKLSLIGVKTDLARKLIYSNPEKAKDELKDVQQTARTALNEVRKMVANMRGIRLKDEIVRVKQILQASQIEFISEHDFILTNVSPLTENILSMCLKEAVTNVVKHSGAKNCSIRIEQTPEKSVLIVQDDGAKHVTEGDLNKGSGLKGMRERLEFVNGSLEIHSHEGTTLIITVPNVVRITEKEALV